MRAWPAAAGWLLAQAAHAACPADGPLQLQWRSEPSKIVVGQPFRLFVTLCPVRTTLLALDATMPEHRHGMNYRPTLVSLGDGRWRADGLLWHMSGRWELRFDLALDGRPQTLRRDVTLP